MERNKLLAFILFALVAIKFCIQPLNTYVDSREQKLVELKKRLLKGEQLLTQKEELLIERVKLKEQMAKFSSLYPTYKDSSAAQIEFQNRIESLANAEDVSIKDIEWKDSTQGVPSSALVVVSFSGNVKKFANFAFKLVDLGVWVDFTKLNYRTRNQNLNWKELGIATGRFEIQIYFMTVEGDV